MLRFRTILPRSIKIIETIPEMIKTCSRLVDRKAFFSDNQSTQRHFHREYNEKTQNMEIIKETRLHTALTVSILDQFTYLPSRVRKSNLRFCSIRVFLL